MTLVIPSHREGFGPAAEKQLARWVSQVMTPDRLYQLLSSNRYTACCLVGTDWSLNHALLTYFPHFPRERY